MYRNAFKTMSIYCEKENCDLKCGHFHLSRSADDKRRSRLKAKQRAFLDTKNVKSLDLLVPINGVVRVAHNHVDKNNSSNNTYLASRRDSSDQKQLSPLTPTTRNLSLGIRQESVDPLSPLSVASTVTLDDIIASARRKISQDYEEPRLPSPVFLDELPSEADRNSWTGMLDVDDGFGEADSFVQHLVDSEDEMWMAEPPTILNDDDQEDFEELLKATRPPEDHFSNPLDRDAKSEKIDLPMRKRHFDRHFDDETSSADLSLADIDPSQMNSCFTPFPPMLRTQISETRPEYEGNL